MSRHEMLEQRHDVDIKVESQPDKIGLIRWIVRSGLPLLTSLSLLPPGCIGLPVQYTRCDETGKIKDVQQFRDGHKIFYDLHPEQARATLHLLRTFIKEDFLGGLRDTEKDMEIIERIMGEGISFSTTFEPGQWAQSKSFKKGNYKKETHQFYTPPYFQEGNGKNIAYMDPFRISGDYQRTDKGWERITGGRRQPKKTPEGFTGFDYPEIRPGYAKIVYERNNNGCKVAEADILVQYIPVHGNAGLSSDTLGKGISPYHLPQKEVAKQIADIIFKLPPSIDWEVGGINGANGQVHPIWRGNFKEGKVEVKYDLYSFSVKLFLTNE